MSAAAAAGYAPRRIAVLRALQLGDLLCAVPALRALRAAAPRAHVTLIGLPWAAEFAQRFHHYVDEHVVLPGIPGLPEQTAHAAHAAALPRFIASMRLRRFDLAIQLHGSGILTNPLIMQFDAARNAGFFPAGHGCPDAARFLPWNDQENEIVRALRLMEFIGIARRGDTLEFPLCDADHQALQDCMDACSARRPPAGTYACVHPGARMPSRRWPVQRFARVADRLAESGLRIVLTGSTQEQALTRAVMKAMRAPAIDLAGKTGLGALAALIAQARIVVCNDTGISHLAAAVATPSVIICSGSDPQRWAPLDRKRHRVVFHEVACRPCMHAVCPIGQPCALGVEVGPVWRHAQEVLDLRDKPSSGVRPGEMHRGEIQRAQHP